MLPKDRNLVLEARLHKARGSSGLTRASVPTTQAGSLSPADHRAQSSMAPEAAQTRCAAQPREGLTPACSPVMPPWNGKRWRLVHSRVKNSHCCPKMARVDPIGSPFALSRPKSLKVWRRKRTQSPNQETCPSCANNSPDAQQTTTWITNNSIMLSGITQTF